MPIKEDIYRPGYRTIPQGEFYKRMELGITYFGNVLDWGYIEADNKWRIKGYLNTRFVGVFHILSINEMAAYVADDRRKDREFEESMLSNNNITTGLGIGFATGSLAAELRLLAGNYTYLNSLAKNGQFLGMLRGRLQIMDNSFLGTHRMNAMRGPVRAKFLANVEKLSWLKKGGMVLGALGTGLSAYQFYNADTSAKRWEYGFDTGMGVFGFFGPLPAFVSLNYSLGKAMFPYAIEYNIERGDRISRGDWSMVWGTRLGQSVK